MELYPVTWVMGFRQILCSVGQWLTKRRSARWVRVRGIVEGYELLLARENGWFVVYYSYDFNERQFSGQWRKWLLFWFSSQEAQTRKITSRFPRGTAIAIRVDPANPNRSVAEPG